MNEKSTKKVHKGQFKKGYKGGPGRGYKKIQPDAIKDYLISKFENDFPVELIERMSESLISSDSKVFLDAFKAIAKLIPEPVKETAPSPVVSQLLERYMAQDLNDIEVMEDKSEFGSETEDEMNNDSGI